MGKAARKYSAADLEAALAARYREPEYVFLPQVRSATGLVRRARTADALAMGTWSSKGLHLLGFEIKVERGDWLRELRQPAKAEEFLQFVDRWYLVSPRAVVKEGELPDRWGWLVPHGTKLRCEREAPPLEADPPDRPFLAAVFRSFKNLVEDDEAVRAMVRKAREEGEAAGRGEAERKAKARFERFVVLERKVLEFEAHSGLNLAHQDVPKLARQARALFRQERTVEDAVRQVGHMRASLLRQCKRLRDLQRALEAGEVPA